MEINKKEIRDAAMKLTSEDIKKLIINLESKDNNLRYKSFLILQSRSDFCNDCYAYFDDFINKLDKDNSYQRSLGLMMIAFNTKWDVENKFDIIVNKFLDHINDEKFITSRQCIQSLSNIIPYKPHLIKVIKNRLEKIDYSVFKDTQINLIKNDVASILEQIESISY
ncbi:MAG: SufBD protein [Bacilli bacterium]